MPGFPGPMPPNLKPLGRQADGSLVMGTPPGLHFPGVPGQVKYKNQSGITLDSAKILSMPAREVCAITDYGERFRDDDSQAQMTWQIPWSVRLAWKEWALGYSDLVGVAELPDEPPSLRRTPPVQHPEMPWLYAVECELVRGMPILVTRDDIPIGDAAKPGEHIAAADGHSDFWQMPAYAELNPETGQFVDGICEYRVTYRDLDYDVRSDDQLLEAPYDGFELNRYVTRAYSYTVKSINVPGTLANAIRFTSGPSTNQVIGQGTLLIRPLIQYEYTWRDVPAPPGEAIAACVGRVNSESFDDVRIGGSLFNAQPHQLLCQAPRIKRYRTKTGRITYDITYRFDADFSSLWGWNAFPAPDGLFYPAAVGGTDLKLSAKFATTTGSPILICDVADFVEQLTPGMTASGTGIPAGSTITALNAVAKTVTISANATASTVFPAVPVTLTFTAGPGKGRYLYPQADFNSLFKVY